MTRAAGWPEPAPTDWWRHTPDSSGLRRPRVLSTAFVPAEELEDAVAMWAAALDVEPDAHLPIHEMGLNVVTVGEIVVVAAAAETLRDFEHVRAVIIVADLGAAHRRLVDAGAEILDGPAPTPVGRHFYARTAQGATVEWVEHRPRPGETARSAGFGAGAVTESNA